MGNRSSKAAERQGRTPPSAQPLPSQQAASPLKCPICYEPYNVKDRQPLALPCMHTFCKACLSAGWPSRCPACREQLPTAIKGVGDLRPNYALMEALEAPSAVCVIEAPSGLQGASNEDSPGLQCPEGHSFSVPCSEAVSTPASSSVLCSLCHVSLLLVRKPDSTLQPYSTCAECNYHLCSLCKEECEKLELRRTPSSKRKSIAAWAKVGDFVTVAPGYRSVEDAGDGPLKPGSIGMVIKVNPPTKQCQVRCCETDMTWWYMHPAMRLVWDNTLTDHFFKEDDYVVLSDAACQTPVPADLEYLNMCALAPGELGRVLKDDGTHIRPWQVHALKSDFVSPFSTKALKKVVHLQPMGPGSIVELTSVYDSTKHGAEGPMRPGDRGVLLRRAKSDKEADGRPYLVAKVCEDGQISQTEYWYAIRALRPIDPASVPDKVRRAAARVALQAPPQATDPDSDGEAGETADPAQMAAAIKLMLLQKLLE